MNRFQRRPDRLRGRPDRLRGRPDRQPRADRLPERLRRLRERLRRLDERALPAGRPPAAVPTWVRGAVVLALPLAVLSLVLAAARDPGTRRLCLVPVALFLGVAVALLRWQRRARG